MEETGDFINWWANDVISIAPKLQFARGDWESKFEVKGCSIVMTVFDNWAIGWNELIGRILIDRQTVGERQWVKCNIKSFNIIKFRAVVIEKDDQFYYRDLCKLLLIISINNRFTIESLFIYLEKNIFAGSQLNSICFVKLKIYFP